MTVFVLTPAERNSAIPVATVTSETIAKEWFRKKTGNDFYPLELDRVDHLGFIANGPQFAPAPVAPPVKRFVMPVVPMITPDMTPAATSKVLGEYLVKLAAAMALIQQALDG